MLVQHHPALLDAACWTSLDTLLDDVGRWLVQSSLPNNVGYVWTPCWMMLVNGWFNFLIQPIMDTFGPLLDDVGQWLVQSFLPTNVGYVWTPCWMMLVDDWFNLLFQPMLDRFGRLVEWCWSMVGSIFSSNQCWLRLDALLDDLGRCLIQPSLPNNVGYVWTPCWMMLVNGWFNLLFQPMLDTF